MSLANRNFNDLVNSLFVEYPSPHYQWKAVNEYGVEVGENEYRLEIPLVGMTRENVTVDVQDNVMTVEAKSEVKSKFVKNFKHTWSLSKDADQENVLAKLENGLLTITVPRIKPVKKVVNVNVV